MDVTHIEHMGRRCAACLALVGAVLVWFASPMTLGEDEAVAQAQPFLDAQAQRAELSVDRRTWTVQAGEEVATLDAETGELLEIRF